MNKVIVIGAGSVGKFIAYNLNHFEGDFEIVGFLDDDQEKHHQSISGYKVIGNISLLKEYSGKGYSLVIGIAFPKIKAQILKDILLLDFHYPNFIAKSAWLSKDIQLGKGCIIYPGTSINYECQIEDFVVINMNCSLGHNCDVGAYSSLAPGVNFGGHTKVGKGVEVGIGAATKQNVVIDDYAIIGGQSMVVTSVSSGDIVAGIPAKSIK